MTQPLEFYIIIACYKKKNNNICILFLKFEFFFSIFGKFKNLFASFHWINIINKFLFINCRFVFQISFQHTKYF